jgi:hypothetical protein
MKLAVTSCFLIALAAQARAEDTTTFQVATGGVKVNVFVVGTENESGLYLPGEEVQATFFVFNASAESVTLVLPEAAMHVAVGGSGTSTDLAHPVRVVLAPGERRQMSVATQVPLDADRGVRFRIGVLVGLSTNTDDIRGIFATGRIAGAEPGPKKRDVERAAAGG